MVETSGELDLVTLWYQVIYHAVMGNERKGYDESWYLKYMGYI